MSLNKINQVNLSKKEEGLLRKIDIKGKGPGGKTWYDLTLQEFKDGDGYIEKFILSMISKLKLKDSCSLFLDGKLGDSIKIKNSLFFKMSENFMFSEEFLPLYKSLYNYLFIQEPKSLGKQVSITVHKEEMLRIFKTASSRLNIDFTNIEELKLDKIEFEKLVIKRVSEDVNTTVKNIIEKPQNKKIIKNDEVILPINDKEKPKDSTVVKEVKKTKPLVKSKGAFEKKLDTINGYSDIDEFLKFYIKERPNFTHKKNVKYFLAILDKFIELNYTDKFIDTIKGRILNLEKDYKFSDKQKDYFEAILKKKEVIISEEKNEKSKHSVEKNINGTEVPELLNKILNISSDEELITNIKLIKDLEIDELNKLFDEISKDFSKYNEVIIKYLLDKKGQQKDTRSIKKIITYLDSINSDYDGWIKKYEEVLGDNLIVIKQKNNIIKSEPEIQEKEIIKEVKVEVVKEVEKVITINQTDNIEKELIASIELFQNVDDLKVYFKKIDYLSNKVLSSYIKKLSEFGDYKNIYKLNKMFGSKIPEELYKICLLDALDIAPKGKDKSKFIFKRLK